MLFFFNFSRRSRSMYHRLAGCSSENGVWCVVFRVTCYIWVFWRDISDFNRQALSFKLLPESSNELHIILFRCALAVARRQNCSRNLRLSLSSLAIDQLRSQIRKSTSRINTLGQKRLSWSRETKATDERC